MTTDDDLSNLVFDPESGTFLPSLAPEPCTSSEIVVLPREEPKPQRYNDAWTVKTQGWSVGDVIEGEDATGFERIRLTAIGEEKVLAKLLATKGKTSSEWEDASVGQTRERMFSLLNKIWRKV